MCINQGDNAEKAHQVQKMSSIYSLAEEVIIWLGLASDGSDLAVEQIVDWSRNDLFNSTDSANKLCQTRMVLIKLGFWTKRTRFGTPLETFSAEVGLQGLGFSKKSFLLGNAAWYVVPN